MARTDSIISNADGRNHPPVLHRNQDLRIYNTFGISARANWLAEIKSTDELQALSVMDEFNASRKLLLGGGSNVLFANDFDGLVIHNAIKGIEVESRDDKHVWLRAGGGEIWNDVVEYAVQHGWGGIENLSLIPGTVGAAPIQNIGAYGVELQEVFERLEAIELDSGRKKFFDRSDCRFGYRDSIFKHELKGKWMVTHVLLRLDRQPKVRTQYNSLISWLRKHEIEDPSVKQISRAVKAIRRSKLPNPNQTGNAGSFFKNPVVGAKRHNELQSTFPEMPAYKLDDQTYKLAAGWLIEKAGWKGKSLGPAATWHQQALVIVNKGGATGKDILALSKKIQEDVEQMFGILLEHEVNIIE